MVEYLNAQGRGDVDAAAAQFADNGILALSGLTGPCNRAHPCTDAAGLRVHLQLNIENHVCFTVTEMDVAGSVITGRFEIRNDTLRANGLDHGILLFLALVPRDKITYLTFVNDATDPQTALAAAIAAGTQPASPPIPNPATPCG